MIPFLRLLGFAVWSTREATIGFGKRYPEYWLNSRPHLVPTDNPDTHICLRAPNSEAVEAFHARALALGPGMIDFDGNKIESVTFPRSQG